MWIIQVRGQARDRCHPVCHPDVGSKLMKRKRTTGPGRWHRGRHFWKRSICIPDDEWNSLLLCATFCALWKKNTINSLFCGLLFCPRIQIYGFWILEVHQPTERGDSITVCVLLNRSSVLNLLNVFYTINLSKQNLAVNWYNSVNLVRPESTAVPWFVLSPLRFYPKSTIRFLNVIKILPS